MTLRCLRINSLTLSSPWTHMESSPDSPLLFKATKDSGLPWVGLDHGQWTAFAVISSLLLLLHYDMWSFQGIAAQVSRKRLGTILFSEYSNFEVIQYATDHAALSVSFLSGHNQERRAGCRTRSERHASTSYHSPASSSYSLSNSWILKFRVGKLTHHNLFFSNILFVLISASFHLIVSVRSFTNLFWSGKVEDWLLHYIFSGWAMTSTLWSKRLTLP